MAKIVSSKFGDRQLVHMPPVKVSSERSDVRVPTLDPKEHYIRNTTSESVRSGRSARVLEIPRRQYTGISADDGRRSTDSKPHRHYGAGNLVRENSVPARQRRDEPAPHNNSLVEGKYRVVPPPENPAGNFMQYTPNAMAQLTQGAPQPAYVQPQQGTEVQRQYSAQEQGQYTPATGQYPQPLPGQYTPQAVPPIQNPAQQQQQQQQPYIQPSTAQFALQDRIGKYATQINNQLYGQQAFQPVPQQEGASAVPGANLNEKHVFYGPNGEILPGPPPGFTLNGSKPRNMDDYPRDFAIEGVCEQGVLRSIQLLHGTTAFPKIPDFLQLSLKQKYKDFEKTDVRIVCRNGEYHVHAVPEISPDAQVPLPVIMGFGYDPYYTDDPAVERTYGSPNQLPRSYPFADRGDVQGPDPMAPFRWEMHPGDRGRRNTNHTVQPGTAVTPDARRTQATGRTQATYTQTPDMRRRPDTMRTQQTMADTPVMWRPTPDVNR